MRQYKLACLLLTATFYPHVVFAQQPCNAEPELTSEVATAFIYPVGFAELMPKPENQPNVNGYVVTRLFGEDVGVRRHAGVDLARGAGPIVDRDVRAIARGRVVYRQENTTGLGHVVRVEHLLPDGQFVYSQYAHMREGSLTVTCGSPVFPGTKIGEVGRTGTVEGDTGIHLHFEIRQVNRIGCGYAPSGICLEPPEQTLDTYHPPLHFIDSRRAGYDFALGFLAVDGNIIGRGNPNGVHDFFDGFADAFLSSAFFYPQGVSKIKEAGGFLRFQSADGGAVAQRFGVTFIEDDVFLNSLLNKGGGNAEITASFRAIRPIAGQFYGIGTSNGSPLLESVAISVGVGSNGRPRVRVNDHKGTTLASDPVQLDDSDLILLRLSVNDSKNEVVASYSINNTSTFKEASQFAFFLRHGTIFKATPTARIFAQGGIRVAQ